ncbi:MAG: phosphoenolpyruvate synthase [Bacteroidia bacterium]|nr:phosphoenolpyruvate synthase [Bacteroidia bacterium]
MNSIYLPEAKDFFRQSSLMTVKNAILTIFLGLIILPAGAQQVAPSVIQARVQAYKKEFRGPFRDIRWFCDDGSTRDPKDPCPDDTGVQHARLKDEVIALGKSNHIFLGQVLATTPVNDFWDAPNRQSRLKQYQLEQYLKNTDDGWIWRKAQYYRGAMQAEDEEAWGKAFFLDILKDHTLLEDRFFLLFQAVKNIPHQGDGPQTQRIRALSKQLSEEYSRFMDLRIKIHGQPEAEDLPAVKAFEQVNAGKLSEKQKTLISELIAAMETQYRPISSADLRTIAAAIPADNRAWPSIQHFLEKYDGYTQGEERAEAIANQMWFLRYDVLLAPDAPSRLAILDLLVKLEELLFLEVRNWYPQSIGQQTCKIESMARAAAATGFAEMWEWNLAQQDLAQLPDASASLGELNAYLARSRAFLEWGTGMVRAEYKDVITLYQAFEPLAYGFVDDRIRSSMLLPLGQEVSKLGDRLAIESALSNQVLRIPEQSQIRGLNPGYAMGELVVISGEEFPEEISNNKIYAFQRPPSDLKPVAGILTVSEGNMVSHVQLLARNLGIPNAVINENHLAALRLMAGQKVFYAVSNRGTVIMRLVSDMTEAERQLFEVKKRSETRIRVPVDSIDLTSKVIDMRDLRAHDSGKLCGPKAANLGELKFLFPNNVVEGLVIPFGLFKSHMDQPMPGQAGSYWEFLNRTFEQANAQQNQGLAQDNIDDFVLKELSLLRDAIKAMPLQPEFEQELRDRFLSVLGDEMGKVPVFLRSDTNMEDLKEFTGAGLNLTLFNVLDAEKIFQGIKDVWASPYTERSYRWRQRYLLNPENVYPSILIIPSVNNDCSGVLITKGISSGKDSDLTVAMSRGVGGAVDGQSAESWLLTMDWKATMLSPAREATYLSLPEAGGTEKKVTDFSSPILSYANLDSIILLSRTIRKIFPSNAEGGSNNPYDVEFGFQNNKLWLFQIRPFVENKLALSSTYLSSISPPLNEGKLISLR